jgi:hypothetical protein
MKYFELEEKLSEKLLSKMSLKIKEDSCRVWWCILEF